MTWPAGQPRLDHRRQPGLRSRRRMATIELLEGGLVDNSARVGALLKDALDGELAGQPRVEEVRGVGLMIGVELRDARAGRRGRAAVLPPRPAGARVRQEGDPVLAAADPHRGAGGGGRRASSRSRRAATRPRAATPASAATDDRLALPLARSRRERVFYTWSAQNAAPCRWRSSSAQGARFETADGARWFDLGSMTWNANLGHGHPRMREALAAAAERGLLAYPTSVFPDKARAGELLAEVAPRGLAKSFICLSGAEANENAVKIARLVTGRKKIVARTRSYHGATLAMLSLSGDPRRERVRARAARRRAHGRPLLLPLPVRQGAVELRTTSAPRISRRRCCARGPRPSRR